MLFSIIIPAYNAENSLQDTLRSICKQTFDDYEIVLVNDGSTDGTEKLCKRFCETNEHARYVKQTNKGVYEARRTGVRNSTGEYLLFVDADDRLRSDSLALLADNIAELNPDVICFRYTRHEDYSNDPLLSSPLTPDFYSGNTLIQVKKCLAQGRLNSIWGKAIKRKCILKSLETAPIQRIDFAEDLLQMISIIEETESLLQIDDILYHYNVQNNQSATHNYRKKQLDDLTYVTSYLIQKAASWDNTIENDALRMRSSQYLYLLLINELTSTKDRKKGNFLSIVRELFSLGDKALPPSDACRPDSHLLYLAAKYENYALAKLVIHTSEAAKGLIRIILSHMPHK